MREALPPGSTIGILGGGQLGRMLAVAAARLGLKTHIYSDEPDCPAFDVCAARTVAGYDDQDALLEFAGAVDVVTCEFENVPAKALETASREAPVYPPARAFAVAQDRLEEKESLRGLGIPLAPFAAVESRGDLDSALKGIGFPALLKTRRFGYDGKGQVVIRSEKDADTALAAIGHVPAIIEGMLLFEREISIVAARGLDGAMRYYDPSENVHQDGILAVSKVPAPTGAACTYAAREIAAKIAGALDYVGVLCVELFQQGDGEASLVVNEIAPRVHNSGHWTLDACAVSQFENHIRAIAGWPLGDPARHSDAVMTNLIGAEANRWPEFAAAPDTCLHLYGKPEARPGRKMGHLTRLHPKT